jgi:hypothetical protein
MAELNNSGTGQWSEVDANNTSPVPDGWPGPNIVLPNQVEPIMRAHMGAMKRFWDRINATVTTTGASGLYVYTPASTAFPTAYVQGEAYAFKAHQTSAGGDTLNINALGAKLLYKVAGTAITAVAPGDITAGSHVRVSYDTTLNAGAGGFLLNNSALGILPGAIAGGGLSNNVGTPNTKIDVQACTATDSTNAVSMGFAGAAKVVDFTVSGAGGLDTGAIAASTWYAILIISGSSGTSVMATKTTAGVAIAPTMPAGYTYFRYLGSVLTDVSSHIVPFFQFGQKFLWKFATIDLNTTTPSTSQTFLTLTIPPAVITFPDLEWNYTSHAGAGAQLLVTTAGQPTGTAPSLVWQVYTQVNNFVILANQTVVPSDTSSRIRYSSSDGTAMILMYNNGWLDPHVAPVF